jgi:hypothetical protein
MSQRRVRDILPGASPSQYKIRAIWSRGMLLLPSASIPVFRSHRLDSWITRTDDWPAPRINARETLPAWSANAEKSRALRASAKRGRYCCASISMKDGQVRRGEELTMHTLPEHWLDHVVFLQEGVVIQVTGLPRVSTAHIPVRDGVHHAEGQVSQRAPAASMRGGCRRPGVWERQQDHTAKKDGV